MLTCIACSKQLDDSGDENTRGTPSTKEAVKSLTSQIKDMALKISGSHKQPKSSTPSSSYRKTQRSYPDFDNVSEGIHYPYMHNESSSSTPAWDFPSVNRDNSSAMGWDARFKGISGGDRTPRGHDSMLGRSGDVVLLDEEEPKEWMAQVEPGVHITFVSLPQGGNDLKRIRFSREMFNKWQAQRWWGENFDRIMELYNVQRFNRQALTTPPRSEDEQRDSSYSRLGSARESPGTPTLSKDRIPKNYYKPSGSKGGYFPPDPLEQGSHQAQHYNAGPSVYIPGFRGETSSIDASRTTTSSRDEASASISNVSDQETEWVEQDEPGVYITIRQLPDGTRELRRVRFSRERFGEVHAKMWWEDNRERIQAQYL
ncbi:protein Brevis radix-like 1 [Macadamia integrifolia]|uniref:protein Brevis radix-like 1 n=1 Tax=Macadamia integrifolia TaxID=60698 RepID=UPI001C4FCDAD|nr:protein Brevis radix-like 1 [Macadamia integrifolia]XP_042504045.1 protein Brevis radix-like 1 [Macadamia integrifolia]